MGGGSGFASVLDFENLYQQLLKIRDCGQAPCAQKLKDQGQWLKPNEQVLKRVRKNSYLIQEIADEFNVNPLVIASVLVSERSINMGWDDQVQNSLAWLLGSLGEKTVMSAGQWVGFDISLGAAQANEEGLERAIKIIQEVSPYRELTLSKLKKNLITYGGNIEASVLVVAALARESQDAYAAFGYNIRDQIGVLVTLHTLDDPFYRAATTAREKRAPNINFLGLFAEKYKVEIQEALTSAVAGQ